MSTACTLDDVALGEVSAARARVAIADALKDASPSSVGRVYASLRAWVWKALNARRRDQELREWFDILKRTSSFLEREFAPFAARLSVLHELIYESVTVSEKLSINDLLRRSHVRDAVRLVAQAPNGRLDRVALGHRLNLKQANLTRVLSLVCSSGLLERQVQGKNVVYQLTRAGQDAAVKLSPEVGGRPVEASPNAQKIIPVSGIGYLVVNVPNRSDAPSKVVVRGHAPAYGDRRVSRDVFPEPPPSLLEPAITSSPLAASYLPHVEKKKAAKSNRQARSIKRRDVHDRLVERSRLPSIRREEVV